jgi:hypothetical protein
MRVQVTLTRVIRQYTEVFIERVESVEQATAQVDEGLTDRLGKARLLKGASWFGDEIIEDVTLAESQEAD